MFYSLCYLFMIFFIASVIGYLVEITFCSIGSKKLVINRGFLIGPYIPIYGVGTVLVVLFLYKYSNDPWVFFWMTVILCSFIEYVTSYIMEKIFKVRWWDYSHEPFNYNGRICLKNSLIFGFAGLIVLYTIYPFICGILDVMSSFLLEVVSSFLFVVFMVDLGFTTFTLLNLRTSLKKFKGKDVTELAHEEVMSAVRKHNFSISRILQAFPHSEMANQKYYNDFRDAVIKYRKDKKKKKTK